MLSNLNGVDSQSLVDGHVICLPDLKKRVRIFPWSRELDFSSSILIAWIEWLDSYLSELDGNCNVCLPNPNVEICDLVEKLRLTILFAHQISVRRFVIIPRSGCWLYSLCIKSNSEGVCYLSWQLVLTVVFAHQMGWAVVFAHQNLNATIERVSANFCEACRIKEDKYSLRTCHCITSSIQNLNSWGCKWRSKSCHMLIQHIGSKADYANNGDVQWHQHWKHNFWDEEWMCRLRDAMKKDVQRR